VAILRLDTQSIPSQQFTSIPFIPESREVPKGGVRSSPFLQEERVIETVEKVHSEWTENEDE
jgi:hypothetical protein